MELTVRDGLDAPALQEIAERLAPYGGMTTLAALAPREQTLEFAEMELLVAQARELLAGYYVHLPLKRALYAVDPIARLDGLAGRVRAMRRSGASAEPEQEDAFHEELGAVFAELRDLHTAYTLPGPYRNRIAFLPFLVEECREGDTSIFPVTKALGTFTDPDFGARGRGVAPALVTHWNGVPIDRAVMRHAARTGGSNAAARRARGVERLTFRWLGRLPRPEEDWVVLTYEVGGDRRHLRFEWLAAERRAAAPAPAPARGERPERHARGMDEEGAWLRGVKAALFADLRAPEQRSAPDVVAYRTFRLPGDGREFGHLRLFSFDVPPQDIPQFVQRVRRLVEGAPPDGLIVDLRGNPGGDIEAAEQLLQLISPGPIQPLGMDFLNTPQALDLAGEVYRRRGAAGRFLRMLAEAESVGAQFLPSPPLAPPQAYNEIGQVYHGPVALLVDALSYSAADIFAASFQDHGLGLVLGPDPQTGGGGGNVWPYESIRSFTGDRMPALPHDATFDVAVRRTTRVADRAGVTLEDRGVVLFDPPLPLTPDDVLGGNEKLLAAVAGAMPGPPYPVSLRVTYDAEDRAFTLHTVNLDRVDVALDDRPYAVVVPDPDETRVPLREGADPAAASFVGFSEAGGGRPVAGARWRAAAPQDTAQGVAQST